MKSIDLSVVITYRKTPDGGKELRYALRSLKNIRNWDGDVFIIGDAEEWFANLTYIKHRPAYGNPYQDVINKLGAVCADSRVPEDFIFSMDDVYVTERLAAGHYHKGVLTGNDKNYYQKSKRRTLDYLTVQGLGTLDYEVHAPFLFNKNMFLEIYSTISKTGSPLQWRSVYGNYHKLNSEFLEDKKTKTAELKQGPIISTEYYTDQLEKLFPEPSIFENHVIH